jgi:hypothetical protein
MNLKEVVGEVIQSRRRCMVAELAGEAVHELRVPAHLGSDHPVLPRGTCSRSGSSPTRRVSILMHCAGELRVSLLPGFTIDSLQYRAAHKSQSSHYWSLAQQFFLCDHRLVWGAA